MRYDVTEVPPVSAGADHRTVTVLGPCLAPEVTQPMCGARGAWWGCGRVVGAGVGVVEGVSLGVLGADGGPADGVGVGVGVGLVAGVGEVDGEEVVAQPVEVSVY